MNSRRRTPTKHAEPGEEPGQEELKNADREVAEARRRRKALDVALDDAEREISAMVTGNRDEWIARQLPELAAAWPSSGLPSSSGFSPPVAR